jgi:hypothetical protein
MEIQPVQISALQTTITERVPKWYHRDEPGVRSLLGNFEIQQRSKFLCVLKIQLEEAAYTSQKNAILEFPHIVERLQHDRWIGRGLDFHRQGI